MQSFTLPLSHAGIHRQDRGRWLRLTALKAIGADDNAFPSLHLALIFVRGFLDLGLNVATFNASKSAATLVDTFDVLPRQTFKLVGQPFDVVRTCQRVNYVGNTTFI